MENYAERVNGWNSGDWIADGMALCRQGRVSRAYLRGEFVILRDENGRAGEWSRREVAVNGWRPLLGTVDSLAKVAC